MITQIPLKSTWISSHISSINWEKVKKSTKTIFSFSFIMLFFTVTGFAETEVNLEGGQTALEDAATDIGGYYGSIKTFVYAIAGIIALFGVARVYAKFSSGDPNAMSAAAQWFGALIFLVVGVTLVGKFFNLSDTE